MLRRRCWAFTSGDYWFRIYAKALVRGGDLGLLGRSWIVGLGTGFKEFPKVLEELGVRYEDVSGFAHVFRTYRVELVSGSPVTLVASAGGSGYAEAVVAMAGEADVGALIGVGLCGALNEALGIGDVVLPVGCVREDGLTGRYVKPGYPAVPNYSLLKHLEECLRREGLEPRTGLVVTTASTFTEGREWAEGLRRAGVLCVECEAAVVLTLARLCRIPAAVALVVSDSVVEGKEAFTSEDLKVGLKDAFARVVRAGLKAVAGFGSLKTGSSP